MHLQDTIEDDRPERDLERLASDTLDSSADNIPQAGKPFPKKGKAATVLRELIAAEGASVDDRHLMRVSGTGYIVNAVASLRANGWVITTSTRYVRDRLGRRVRRRSYALDHANIGIPPKHKPLAG